MVEEMACQRDERGRFVKGYNGGPGRPPKAREKRYYEITISTCTYKQWTAIIKKAVEQALEGDATARKWLSDYLVGSPKQYLEHSGELGVFDLAEWKKRQQEQLDHIEQLEE